MNIDLNHSEIGHQLNYLNVIKISGRDAISFLNDQFTNDITALESGKWQFNGYCTSKGRLIALFRLFVSDDCVYIVLPQGLSQQVVKRLQIYVFRAKVKFETLVDYSVYCLPGVEAENIMGEIPAQTFKHNENGFILNISIQADRYLAILYPSDTLSHLDVISQKTSEQLWRLSEIRDGIPNIDIETSEMFIPQHVNLDNLNGISFKKGCFPGQEVVARLHYLGKAKQTMRHIKIESTVPIKPAETFNHPDYKKALKIVDAVQTHDECIECLAVGQFE